ncbi:MAG: CoA-binding protein [Spirochaetes bacterium]|nr:CoA-binding protein [Spirochaetota bacterium]
MNLDKIFNAKTMAVIGVSLTNDSHPANVIYNKNRYRYPLTVYPVNPKGGTIKGEYLYKNVADIPDTIDLAVIAARAEFVPDILQSCIDKKVGGAIIVSGGFAESDNEDIQQRIVEMAKKADFPFIGPNCLGIFSPGKIDTLFLPAERLIQPMHGNIAFISQSGGVMVDQMVKFKGQGIGVSTGISIGNKAMLKEIDLLEYLAKDPDTKVIVFYIEGFGKNEGRAFVEAVNKCPKPVIVIKGGRSSQGSHAASSHTASMAGDHRVFSEVMKQYGILEATNGLELSSYCEALSSYPKGISGKLGIITVSGGHGVLSVDYASDLGLNIPPLSASTKELIKQNLSPSVKAIASLENPVDLTGSAVDDDFLNAARVLIKSNEVDCILLLILPYSPGVSIELGAKMSNVCLSSGMPLLAYVPNEERYRMLIEGFELNQVPVSASIEGTVLMAKALIGEKNGEK